MSLLSGLGKTIKFLGKASLATYLGLTGFYVYRYLTDDEAEKQTAKNIKSK